MGYRVISKFMCLLQPHNMVLTWVVWNLTRASESILYISTHFFHFVCCCLLTQSCPALSDPRDCSTPGFPVLHHLPKFAQTHAHWVGDAIQPPPPLPPPSPFAVSFSQHQGLLQWVGSSHQVAKVLELQVALIFSLFLKVWCVQRGTKCKHGCRHRDNEID